MEYEIGADEAVTTAIVRAVSAVEGRDPGSLPPLAETLDPTAVDALFEPRSDGTPRTGGSLSFVYCRCEVTIENGEYLTINTLGTRLRDGRGSEPTDRRRS